MQIFPHVNRIANAKGCPESIAKRADQARKSRTTPTPSTIPNPIMRYFRGIEKSSPSKLKYSDILVFINLNL